MKKLLIVLFAVMLGIVLTGCSDTGLTLPSDGFTTSIPTSTEGTTNVPISTAEPTTLLPTYEERIPVGVDDGCQGQSDYIVIDGECIVFEDLLSKQIQLTDTVTEVTYDNGVESMGDLIADLSGSTGLAVLPREMMAEQVNMTPGERQEMVRMSTVLESDTENVIVKLNQEGMFEEVSFTHELGYEVKIDSNPLALEVFGDYTVIAFEIVFDDNFSNDRDFNQKIFDSLYSGGIYLIHNETGKLFSTSIIEYDEVTEFDYEYEYETITTTANVDEPVTRKVQQPMLDENGDPILDEFGEPMFIVVEEEILDSEGNPIIFEEGPIVTETKQFPQTETYLLLVHDENGDPLLDENGDPIYEEITEPVLNSDGKQMYYNQEVPVYDENGDTIYQTDFEVEIDIRHTIETAKTVYYGHITDGPLSKITRKFVDRILENYNNWNYYRVHNYQIDFGFAETDEHIYYIENREVEGQENLDLFVMRLSFDSETNELVIEEYLNATKAGFDQGQMIIDPLTKIILFKNYNNESNIKIYSPTIGLKSIPNSDSLNIRILPNNELYLIDINNQYIESLGYSTQVMYQLNSDGSLNEHYIELGEVEATYQSSQQINATTKVGIYQNGELINPDRHRYVSTLVTYGDSMIDSADLNVLSITEFDSTRPVCEDSEGCMADIVYRFYMGEELVGQNEDRVMYYPGDTPPLYSMSYQLNDNSTYYYYSDNVEEAVVCDNDELGCLDKLFIRENINGTDYAINGQILVSYGEKLINDIRVLPDNNGLYEYSRTEYGQVCDYAQCETNVNIQVFDLLGEIISNQVRTRTFNQGEVMPIIIEYRMSNNTGLVEGSTCSSPDGCYKGYNDVDGQHYSIHYNQGELMYDQINFVESDITLVNEKTYYSEACTDINGCYIEDVKYIVNDSEGNLLYEFTRNISSHYGDQFPFKVTLTLDDVEINYDTESVSYPRNCEKEVCTETINIFKKTSNNNNEYLGSITVHLNQGEQLFSQITLNENATYFDYLDEKYCLEASGCIVNTFNYNILDSDGNDITHEEEIYLALVKFAYGEKMPSQINPEVIYELTNIEYVMTRVNSFHIFSYMENFTILEENVFFIKRPSWSQGELNYILEYDDVDGTYFATYTNLPFVQEIAPLGDGYIGINNDQTAIYYFELNLENSTESYYHYDFTNLTEDQQINEVNNLIIDYDGSIYFEAVDSNIQEITGKIAEDGTITIDTVYTEYEIVRISPLN